MAEQLRYPCLLAFYKDEKMLRVYLSGHAEKVLEEIKCIILEWTKFIQVVVEERGTGLRLASWTERKTS